MVNCQIEGAETSIDITDRLNGKTTVIKTFELGWYENNQRHESTGRIELIGLNMAATDPSIITSSKPIKLLSIPSIGYLRLRI